MLLSTLKALLVSGMCQRFWPNPPKVGGRDFSRGKVERICLKYLVKDENDYVISALFNKQNHFIRLMEHLC